MFCGGTVGGGGGVGSDACDPRSAGYRPDDCPWDLTYARWPLSQRLRVWVTNGNLINFSGAIKNVGTGTFRYIPVTFRNLGHLSLVAIGSDEPVVPYESNLISDGDCNSLESISINPFQSEIIIPPDGVKAFSGFFRCSASGRFRLWIHVDPTGLLDYTGLESNNIGRSLTRARLP